MTHPFPHTPGPWAYRPCRYDDTVFAVTAGDTTLAQVERWNADPDGPAEAEAEAAANARLVAAAPDLAETLAALLDATDGLPVCRCSGRMCLAQGQARGLLATLAAGPAGSA